MKSINPVAIGMRFYDDNSMNANHYQVLEKEYYKKAIEIIGSMKENVTFFVFSLNIKRAKKIFPKGLMITSLL